MKMPWKFLINKLMNKVPIILIIAFKIWLLNIYIGRVSMYRFYFYYYLCITYAFYMGDCGQVSRNVRVQFSKVVNGFSGFLCKPVVIINIKNLLITLICKNAKTRVKKIVS